MTFISKLNPSRGGYGGDGSVRRVGSTEIKPEPAAPDCHPCAKVEENGPGQTWLTITYFGK